MLYSKMPLRTFFRLLAYNTCIHVYKHITTFKNYTNVLKETATTYGWIAKQIQQDMCLWNMDAPGGNKVKLWQKYLKVLHFDPAPPPGYVRSVKCEQPLDELTVQVWLLYDRPKL